ncbi:MAG TPA: hypothetical protein ENH86_02270 [Candidatus Jorgensenbacteria bacterium]|nr:hypothetical protein [Candidatus Jorgensenbacteria bacterium]
MKKIIGGLIIVLVIITGLYFWSAQQNGGSGVQIVLGELSLSDQPILNTLVTVTLILIPEVDIPNYPASIEIPNSFELVSGYLDRQVNLKAREEFKIEAIIKPTEVGHYKLRASVGDDLYVEVIGDNGMSDMSISQFGSCKPLVYKGSISNKINFVFIPAEEMQNEQELVNSVKDFFDENKESSFYTIYPYSEYKDDFNFFYLDEYSNLENLRTIKRVLMEKCPGLSSNIYQIISTGSQIRGTGHDYLRTINKIGYQSISSYSKSNLHTFLHEIGHSFGGLDEGYGKGFTYDLTSISGVTDYKKNYNDNSDLPPNWDIEGCPKWCSGQINTNSVCYEDYISLKRCLLSSETDNDKEAQDCVMAFDNTLEGMRVMIYPHECDFGINCVDNTNCWFVGNGYFRAYARDLMYSGSDDFGIITKSYGPAGGKQLKETIELLKLWIYQKNNLREVHFEIVDSYFHSFNDRDEVYIEFGLSDSTGNTLSIFKDEMLDNVFSIKYKKSGEPTYFDVGVNKRLGGNYYVAATEYRSEKDLPPDRLDFIFAMELPRFKKTWSFVLNRNN